MVEQDEVRGDESGHEIDDDDQAQLGKEEIEKQNKVDQGKDIKYIFVLHSRHHRGYE